MSAESPPDLRFADLALSEPLLRALADVGYESPSPIQAATIPPLLAGRDVLGQAQTGTGKTAAFALPILARIDPAQTKPQALVLAPTRELAIQVAEAFQSYATHLPGFHVLPIYGGQGYGPQLRRAQARRARRRRHARPRHRPSRTAARWTCPQLTLPGARRSRRDAAHGLHRRRRSRAQEDAAAAPGRAVLGDDAVADPPHRADLPAAIRSRSRSSRRPPPPPTSASATGWSAASHKLDALTRILEAEPFDAMLVFARTKLATEELAEKLAGARTLGRRDQRRHRAGAARDARSSSSRTASSTSWSPPTSPRAGSTSSASATCSTTTSRTTPKATCTASAAPAAPAAAARRSCSSRRASAACCGAIERATRQPIEPMQLPSVEAVNDQRVGEVHRPHQQRGRSAGHRPFSASWSNATSANTTCRRSRSRRRWRSSCRAIRRCCCRRRRNGRLTNVPSAHVHRATTPTHPVRVALAILAQAGIRRLPIKARNGSTRPRKPPAKAKRITPIAS